MDRHARGVDDRARHLQPLQGLGSEPLGNDRDHAPARGDAGAERVDQQPGLLRRRRLGHRVDAALGPDDALRSESEGHDHRNLARRRLCFRGQALTLCGVRGSDRPEVRGMVLLRIGHRATIEAEEELRATSTPVLLAVCRDEMEVVLLLVGIVGIALVVVPRMQRRSGSGRRTTPATSRPRRTTPSRKGKRTAAAAATPAVATWTPVTGPGRAAKAAAAPADDDGWDDDLGWEGVERAAAAPEAREAWEHWRTTESPLAAAQPEPAAPEPPVQEPAAELPSVERWRAQAQEEDWVEDDDGLGWEGAATESWSPNGNGHGAEPEPASWRPAPAPGTDGWATRVNGRDWSRGEASPAEPVAPPSPPPPPRPTSPRSPRRAGPSSSMTTTGTRRSAVPGARAATTARR